jgi:hypothetical protein
VAAAASGARSGKRTFRLAFAAPAVEAVPAQTAPDGMALGGLALLTLAVSSAGLLLVLVRSHEREAHA